MIYYIKNIIIKADDYQTIVDIDDSNIYTCIKDLNNEHFFIEKSNDKDNNTFSFIQVDQTYIIKLQDILSNIDKCNIYMINLLKNNLTRIHNNLKIEKFDEIMKILDDYILKENLANKSKISEDEYNNKKIQLCEILLADTDMLNMIIDLNKKGKTTINSLKKIIYLYDKYFINDNVQISEDLNKIKEIIDNNTKAIENVNISDICAKIDHKLTKITNKHNLSMDDMQLFISKEPLKNILRDIELLKLQPFVNELTLLQNNFISNENISNKNISNENITMTYTEIQDELSKLKLPINTKTKESKLEELEELKLGEFKSKSEDITWLHILRGIFLIVLMISGGAGTIFGSNNNDAQKEKTEDKNNNIPLENQDNIIHEAPSDNVLETISYINQNI